MLTEQLVKIIEFRMTDVGEHMKIIGKTIQNENRCKTNDNH